MCVCACVRVIILRFSLHMVCLQLYSYISSLPFNCQTPISCISSFRFSFQLRYLILDHKKFLIRFSPKDFSTEWKSIGHFERTKWSNEKLQLKSTYPPIKTGQQDDCRLSETFQTLAVVEVEPVLPIHLTLFDWKVGHLYACCLLSSFIF